MTQSLPIPMDVSASDSMVSYMRAVNAAPILTAEREYELRCDTAMRETWMPPGSWSCPTCVMLLKWPGVSWDTGFR